MEEPFDITPGEKEQHRRPSPTTPITNLAWFGIPSILTATIPSGFQNALLLQPTKLIPLNIFIAQILSGLASSASVKTSPYGEEKSGYKVEWVAESITPITAFKLQYRPEGTSSWSDDILVTPTSNGDHLYSGKYKFQKLQLSAHYEVRISSKNEYGFNDWSEAFAFGTKGAGKNKIGFLYFWVWIFHNETSKLTSVFVVWNTFVQYFWVNFIHQKLDKGSHFLS